MLQLLQTYCVASVPPGVIFNEFVNILLSGHVIIHQSKERIIIKHFIHYMTYTEKIISVHYSVYIYI